MGADDAAPAVLQVDAYDTDNPMGYRQERGHD
jgi:hypothetical protein